MSQNTGELRHPLEVMGKEKVPDGGGGFEYQWVAQKRVWGKVNPASADLINDYAKREMEISHNIEIRGPTDITSEDKIRFKGERWFEIEAIKNVEERDFVLNITAREIEGDSR